MGLRFALSNDRGLAPRRRAPPIEAPAGRPKGRWIPRASEVPTCPNKAVGAAARRFGSAFALYNGSTTTKPAPRGLCEKSPNLAAELPLPLGAAALALKCAARLPNDGSAAFPLSALAWCVAFPQRRLLLFPLAALCYASRFPTSSLVRPTPAPDLLVPHSSPKLPLRVPSGAGRSSRCVRLAVDVCFALQTDSPRGTGATRAACAAQNRARRFPDQASLPRKCRARFTALRRASPPIH